MQLAADQDSDRSKENLQVQDKNPSAPRAAAFLAFTETNLQKYCIPIACIFTQNFGYACGVLQETIRDHFTKCNDLYYPKSKCLIQLPEKRTSITRL